MKRKISNSYLKLSGLLSVLAALVVLFGAGSVFASCPPGDPLAATVTIGGNVYEGSNVQVGVDPLGFPIYEPVYAPTAPAVSDPQVMVQNMHSGGEFICYAPVTAGTNSWSAEVAVPGDYVVIIGAAGHDTTSREFKLDGAAATGVVGSTLKDAYVAPFPRNSANLLLYAFRDNYINSEDDFPDDVGLYGVTFTITHEDGAVFTGVSGTQTVADMPMGGAGPDMNGLYYFTDIPYGAYDVHADPSTVLIQTGAGWHLVLEEGGTSSDVLLRPGDEGTLDRAYLVWFGFVERQGQLSPPVVIAGEVANTGTISGTLIDADGNAGFLEPFVTDQACPNSGVNPQTGNIDVFDPDAATEDCIYLNARVKDGFVVLWEPGIANQGPVATVLADPVTGEYEFVNVPPGAYKLFTNDVPGDYIWQTLQVNMPPQGILQDMDIMVPRWFARANGSVLEINDEGEWVPYIATPLDIVMRLKSGSVWQRETTDGTGYFNFNELGEKEAIGSMNVVLPAGYRGVQGDDVCYEINTAGDAVLVPGPASATVTCHTPDLSARNMLWFTANYRTNPKIERIPAEVGHVRGYVYNDSLTYDDTTGTWLADGLYDEEDDRTLHGVTVRLLDDSGTVIATTATGKLDEDLGVAQGLQAGPIPIGGTAPVADEAGRIFKGPVFGQFNFRDVPPGDYTVEVDPLEGFSPSPAGTDSQAIIVAGGARNDVNIGMNTLLPLAGEIEGGIFDDIFLDTNPMSSWAEEKRKIPNMPIGMYDEFGFKMAVAFMENPLCFAGEDYVYPDPVPFGAPLGVEPGDRVCPAGEELYQNGEIEIRANQGVHSYFANDPSEPGYHPAYEGLALNYGTKQGQFAYETEWALLPLAFTNPVVGTNLPIIPENTPVINNGGPSASNIIGPAGNGGEFAYAIGDGEAFETETIARRPRQPRQDPRPTRAPKERKNKNKTYSYTINGSNFGPEQGHSTVSLSGTPLKVDSWSDTQIVVQIPVRGVSGALVVSTASGPSNAIDVTVDGSTNIWEQYLAARTVYVTANAASGGDGSVGSPVGSINAALQNLPRRTPRYVIVGPGVYRENVQITQSNVRLIGAGAYRTMIDGNDPVYVSTQGGVGTNIGPAITIGNGGLDGGVSNVIVSGFTITGGNPGTGGFGGGVFGQYGNDGIDINNNIIGRNGGEYGGGVWLHNSNHNVRIWSNIIAENGNYGGYGGGISVSDEPEYEDAPLPKGAIEPTDATHHTYDDDLGLPLPGTYEIFNNVIFHNFSMDYGGGISLYEVKDHLKIYGNAILENRSDDHGGGMFFEDTGPIDIYDNVFLRNSCPDDGGAISFEDVGDSNALVKIYNNLFAENIADDRGENHARGGAISLDDTLYVEIFNNTIVGNIVAGEYNPAGGAIDSERHGHEYGTGFSDPKIYNNIIWGNWRLNYEDGGIAEGGDYNSGINYTWTEDNLHVDNPALNGDFETYLNSESFTHVVNNIIGNGEYSSRRGNSSQDPLFVDPANLNWSLQAASPAVDRSPARRSPATDILLHDRSKTRGKVDLGAFEYQDVTPNNVIIPTGIMGAIQIPVPGSTEME